jgi:type II secretory pathway component PulF
LFAPRLNEIRAVLQYFFAPRIALRPLADLCHRLGTSLGAGVDARKVLAREKSAARGTARQPLESISLAVDRGSTLTEAIDATNGYFPVMFREMVAVGEQSGKLSEVFRQLEENYEYQLRMRRAFVSAITGPMLQLFAAIAVVGLLIWIMGLLPRPQGGKPIDLLGFGLIGNEGLITYLFILAAIGAACVFLYRAVQRGVLWVRPLQKFAMRIPKLGRCLETLSLARLTWAMHVTLDSGMDLRRAIKLSLDSTHNVRYTEHSDAIWTSIRGGNDLYEALLRTGVFPHDFMDTIQVGEQSGRLAESMANLSRRYQEESQAAMHTLTVIGGFAVWAAVAGLIIMIIFRLFGFYTGILNDALKG